MKNPRELTLGEILMICETEARDHLEGAQKLLLFLEWRENQMKNYQVRHDQEQVRMRRESNAVEKVSRRRSNSLDAALFEACVLVDR